jgi:hypothetical protein
VRLRLMCGSGVGVRMFIVDDSGLLEDECDGREKEGDERSDKVEMRPDRMVVDFEVALASGWCSEIHCSELGNSRWRLVAGV